MLPLVRQAARALPAATALALLTAVPAEAHGIVGRADLPLPEELFAAGAAVVLVLSFLALAALWSSPRLEEPRERRLFRLPRAVDVLLGIAGVVLFAAAVYAGLAGTESQPDNLAPTLVYVVFWVGVPFASLVLGDVFRLLSPWRAIGRMAGWVAARAARGALPEPLAYPERLGQWPAAAGLLIFAICELAWGPGREPATLALLMLLYLAAQLVGMSLFGVETWTRRGDTFGVLFSMVARLAPIGRRDGVLVLRAPGAGAAGLRPVAGTVALLLLAIGTTAFDGAREGPLFNDAAPALQDAFVSLGLSQGAALELAFTLGLVVVVALVCGVWWLAVEGMPRSRPPRPRAALGRRLAHSLIPIAAAYVVAHYFSLLAYQGQAIWRLASDPLGTGTGTDLFGGANSGIDYAVVSASGIWYVQVGALVVGHVLALVLAHDRALVLYGSARAAARSQLVMLFLMVCFTCLGLWLLSSANAG